MYEQIFDPIADSLGYSTIFAVLPLLTIFVLLGVLKWKAQWAALASLAVSLIVAIAVYGMPADQAASAGLEGATFGLFPIMWIVVNAIWIYNMTVATGHFDALRRSFGTLSTDQRIQAIIIAFCFGALLEALAGFGTPVAISAVMLLGLGFSPLKAASVALVANTAPVAFGAIAVPIITLARVTNLPVDELGATVGRQTPLLALFVPLVLVFMVDGMRGIRQAWLPAVVCGVAFAIGQFLCSNYFSIELTDIVAALISVGALVVLLRFWQPSEILAVATDADQETRGPSDAATESAQRVEGAKGRRSDPGRDRVATPAGGRLATAGGPGGPSFAMGNASALLAYAPYALIIAVFGVAQIPAVKDALAEGVSTFAWPGLDVVAPSGKAPGAATYSFNWLPAAGTLLLLSGVLTAFVIRLSPARAVRAYGDTLYQLRWAILVVAAVLALAYVMNLSGQTITIGQWMAGAGGLFAFLSPVLGWLGVAVTGSDTSSNALFGTLQVAAAADAGLDPILAAAGNSSGGVLGKMISPQNLAIAAAAVGMAGQEGDLFRKVFGWSIGFLLLMAVVVYLQSTSVLSWMV